MHVSFGMMLGSTAMSDKDCGWYAAVQVNFSSVEHHQADGRRSAGALTLYR